MSATETDLLNLEPGEYPRPMISDAIAKLMAEFNATYELNPETATAFVKSTGLPYFKTETKGCK
ncbi:MAG: hypothetical protein GY906_12765 [bacterium]|nr:hypothetical protein [bacterium]